MRGWGQWVVTSNQWSVSSESVAFAGEHELVAFGVDAHGEVWGFVIFGLGFAGECAACSGDFGSAGDDIWDLEAEAGPCAVAFAAAVDTDDAVGDLDLSDGGVLSDDFGSKDLSVKGDGAVGVRSPDDVFQAFNLHD